MGHAPTWDRVVIRGDLDERRFLAFWMREGRVVAGMSANIPKVVGAMRTLIESRSVVDAGRLADADVPLAELG
ncbi:MAG: oxidoreductase C-terminal domain-containing protein [Chloroflexota bacterium]